LIENLGCARFHVGIVRGGVGSGGGGENCYYY